MKEAKTMTQLHLPSGCSPSPKHSVEDDDDDDDDDEDEFEDEDADENFKSSDSTSPSTSSSTVLAGRKPWRVGMTSLRGRTLGEDELRTVIVMCLKVKDVRDGRMEGMK